MNLRLLLSLASLGAGLAFSSASVQAGVMSTVTFRVVGEVTSEKYLHLFGYVGDGEITSEDFTYGELDDEGGSDDPGYIGKVLLKPLPRPVFLTDNPADTEIENQDIDFDITDFLEYAFEESNPKWIGFNLRETSSNGNVVTLEYLVLGAFLSQTLVVGVTGSATVTPTTMGLPDVANIMENPTSTNVMNNGMTETRGVVEFQVQPVPEPASALVWLTGGGIAMVVRRRRAARSAS